MPDKLDASATVVYDFYAYLNSFDFYTRVMADLYASYREVIGVSVAAFGKGIITRFRQSHSINWQSIDQSVNY